jgi:hypothetical protein
MANAGGISSEYATPFPVLATFDRDSSAIKMLNLTCSPSFPLNAPLSRPLAAPKVTEKSM